MVWPGLRSTSRRSADLYLNYLNPPQTSILLRGLVQGEIPRKVVHECVLQSVELIQGRQMAACQKCFFTCFQSTFSYCMYNMKCGLISEINKLNMYNIDATAFFHEIHSMFMQIQMASFSTSVSAELLIKN